MKSGSPSDLIFASIAGTQKCNDTFGVNVETLRKLGRRPCDTEHLQVQMSCILKPDRDLENAGNMHYGADMATLEARTYGFGRHFGSIYRKRCCRLCWTRGSIRCKAVHSFYAGDVFMAKMSGIPIGTDIAFSSHVKADYNDNDVVMMAASLQERNTGLEFPAHRM